MDKEMKRRWCEALRGGTYQQGQVVLRNNEDKFCCLGVLCDITRLGTWEQREENDEAYLYLGSTALLPEEVEKETGLKDNATIGYLTARNDIDNQSFEQIADYIEKNL